MSASVSSPHAPSERLQTPAEEKANFWSSAAGLLLAVGGLPVLAGLTLASDDDLAQLGAAAFGVTLVAMYAISAVYHALPQGPRKVKARLADRISIYALIAGTYSPFALGPLRDAGGIWLFALQWIMALGGAAFVLLGGIRLRRISIGLYLAMGWLGILFLPAFLQKMSSEGLFWLLAGGIVYTAGVPFYMAKRLPFSHLAWHVMVIGGSACHFLAVLVTLR
jgi:Predicted membrane protein, hemolysin III homolog